MTYKNFLKVISRIKAIAEENEIEACDIVVTIRITSGQEIKAWAQELDYTDNEVLEIFTDDTYRFVTYSNIESIAI